MSWFLRPNLISPLPPIVVVVVVDTGPVLSMIGGSTVTFLNCFALGHTSEGESAILESYDSYLIVHNSTFVDSQAASYCSFRISAGSFVVHNSIVRGVTGIYSGLCLLDGSTASLVNTLVEDHVMGGAPLGYLSDSYLSVRGGHISEQRRDSRVSSCLRGGFVGGWSRVTH